MKTVLHYQISDIKQFVLENLEKRGYKLAAGTEPMLADLDDMDDPETVLMEVLVEERPSTTNTSIARVIAKPLVAVEEDLAVCLPTPAQQAPTQTQEPGPHPAKTRIPKARDLTLSEEALAKQEAKRAYWRQQAQAKRDQRKMNGDKALVRKEAEVRAKVEEAEKKQGQAATLPSSPLAFPDHNKNGETLQERIERREQVVAARIGTESQEVVVAAPVVTTTPFRTSELFRQASDYFNNNGKDGNSGTGTGERLLNGSAR